MTKNEFVEKIENGRDISFDVNGKHMVIFTWLEDGIGIGEQHKAEPMSMFEDAASLVSEYLVDGVLLEDLVGKIRITDYS